MYLSLWVCLLFDSNYRVHFNFVISLDNNEQCAGAIDTAMRSCSCSSQVGIAVGVIVVVVCLVVMVITVIVVLCWWRYVILLIC